MNFLYIKGTTFVPNKKDGKELNNEKRGLF